MPQKRRFLFSCAALFIAWNVVLIFYLLGRAPRNQDQKYHSVMKELTELVNKFEEEIESQNKILLEIERHRQLWAEHKGNGTQKWRPVVKKPQSVVIPILVIACNRVTVKRCLDKLLEYRPSAENFPIIVSQDCGHAETANVIAAYGSKVTHIKQPDLSDIPVPLGHRKFQGYYKISRHYRWALTQVFHTFSYSTVIVVEDDLEVFIPLFIFNLSNVTLLPLDCGVVTSVSSPNWIKTFLNVIKHDKFVWPQLCGPILLNGIIKPKYSSLHYC